ncbi:MAG TPA: hypothetical protein VLG36_01585 [Candidatus Chromulinivoraceae bacterium]|nr:hypothetical protein [Candidatus Chromulinivoraceae bacterium]
MTRVDELKSQIAQCEDVLHNPRSGVRKIIKATVRHRRLINELIEEENRIHEIEMAAMRTHHEVTMAKFRRDCEEELQAPVSLDFSSVTLESLYGGSLPPDLRRKRS